MQQDTTGHRGRRGDSLYRIQSILRAGQEHLTDRYEPGSRPRSRPGPPRGRARLGVRPAGPLRLHQDSHAAGRAIAQTIFDSYASCPIPEVARLGRTLKQWRSEFLGYFDTGEATNGGTEAINGLIELHRPHRPRLPHRESYRLRMLLVAGGLLP